MKASMIKHSLSELFRNASDRFLTLNE